MRALAAAAITAAALLLSPALPQAAAAQSAGDAVSVSNLHLAVQGVEVRIGLSGTGASAAAFTTGNWAPGYRLTSATVLTSNVLGSPGDIKVTINEAAGGIPGTALATLTGANPTTIGQHTYTAPADSVTLRPGTAYFLTLDAPDSSGVNFYGWRQKPNGEELGDDGWIIADNYRRSTTANPNFGSTVNQALQFRIDAVQITPPPGASNIGVSHDGVNVGAGFLSGSSWFQQRLAQGFETGGTGSQRFPLVSVAWNARAAIGAPGHLFVTLHEANPNNTHHPLLTPVATLTNDNPRPYGGGHITYTSTQALNLKGNTRYFIVWDADTPNDGHAYRHWTTPNDNEDSNNHPGWGINDTGLFSHNNSWGWNNIPQNRALLLRVRAQSVSAQTNRAPTVGTALPAASVAAGDAIIVDLADAFTDPEGDFLSYTVTSSAPGVAAARLVEGRVFVNGLKFTGGSAQIIVRANDGSLTASQTMNVTVTARSFIVVSDARNFTTTLADNITLVVTNTGSIGAPGGGNAVAATVTTTGATIRNSGAITGNTAANDVNALHFIGNGNTFTNESGGTITTTRNGNFGAQFIGDDNIVVNRGTVVTNGNWARGLNSDGNNNRITVETGGSVETKGNANHPPAIEQHGGSGNVAINRGTLTVASGHYGAVGIRQSGGGNRAYNYGTINANGRGITSIDDGNYALNADTITSANFGMESFGDNNTIVMTAGSITVNGNNAAGINIGDSDNSGDNHLITVSGGTITATGNDADGIRIDGDGNRISITAASVTVSGARYGIYTDNQADNNTITVNGTVQGGSNSIKVEGSGNVIVLETDAVTVGAMDIASGNTVIDRRPLALLVIADQTYSTETPVALDLPTATGGTGPYNYTLRPALPGGLTFNGAADPPAISGMPLAAAAATNYTYTAESPAGITASRVFGVTVNFARLANGVPVFVENFSRHANASGAAVVSNSESRSNAFTTGNNASGYHLRSLVVGFRSTVANPPDLRAAIHAANGNVPGAELAVLRGPNPVGEAQYPYTPSAGGFALAANTTYFLVLSAPGSAGGNYQPYFITEESGSAVSDDNWRIASPHCLRSGGGAWSCPSPPGFLSRLGLVFRINAAAGPAPANRAPTVGTAIPPQTIMESGTADVPLAGAFEDADGNHLNYRAVSGNAAVAEAAVSGANVTVSANRVGNTAITVFADDGGGMEAMQNFMVTVTPGPCTGAAFCVSNLEQPRDSFTSIVGRGTQGFNAWAQEFTTGAGDRFALRDVTVRFWTNFGAPNDLTVELHNPLGTPVATLTGPTRPNPGENEDVTFTAPAGTTLEVGTNYNVVFLVPDGGQNDIYRLTRATASNEDAGSDSGWSIGDVAQISNQPGGGNWRNASGGPIRMRVRAEVAGPSVSAGGDSTATEGESVTLRGSATAATDGSTISAVGWTQTAGPTVMLAGADNATVTFTAPDIVTVTVLEFRLLATDNRGRSAMATARVTIMPERADVNGDGAVDANDAAVLHAVLSGAPLADAASRARLLAGVVGSSDDTVLQAAIESARRWAQTGLALGGGDVNADGAVNAADALVMQYAFTLPGLLGDGGASGPNAGLAHWRAVLLGALVQPRPGSGETPDAAYRRALSAAQALGAPLSAP